MKKLFLMLSVVGLATFSLTSCGKPDQKPAIRQTITVQLETNEAYTFVLPQNLRNDAYEFTSQASHYSISVLGTNSVGQNIYQYTPETNYTGTDQVTVSNDWEKEDTGPCGNPQGGPGFGNCMNGGQEDHYVVTFKFNIGRVVTANSDEK